MSRQIYQNSSNFGSQGASYQQVQQQVVGPAVYQSSPSQLSHVAPMSMGSMGSASLVTQLPQRPTGYTVAGRPSTSIGASMSRNPSYTSNVACGPANCDPIYLPDQIIREVVEIPQVIYTERRVDVPQVMTVEKIVNVPKIQTQERIVEVPRVVTQERLVEIPQYQRRVHVREEIQKPEYRETIVEVPKIVTQEVEKIVEIPQVQYVDRHVDVPQIQEVVRCVPGPVQVQDVYENAGISGGAVSYGAGMNFRPSSVSNVVSGYSSGQYPTSGASHVSSGISGAYQQVSNGSVVPAFGGQTHFPIQSSQFTTQQNSIPQSWLR
jgi:hypothetical protein